MIELTTPSEIIDSLTINIEKSRKQMKLRQVDLCEIADVPLATYQSFIYKKNISLVSLIKIMYSLKMWDNLEGLIAFEEIKTIEDIRIAKKQKQLPKRIRKSSER